MKNVSGQCVVATTESCIKFQENKSIIRFQNKQRFLYKKVLVDGCAIKEGLKCDYLLCSENEYEERFIELKGSDVPHAIEQLRASIERLGQFNDNRYSYIVCTKVAPQITTRLQIAKKEFKTKYKSDLIVKETPVEVRLN